LAIALTQRASSSGSVGLRGEASASQSTVCTTSDTSSRATTRRTNDTSPSRTSGRASPDATARLCASSATSLPENAEDIAMTSLSLDRDQRDHLADDSRNR
jgi:hypothetical protein